MGIYYRVLCAPIPDENGEVHDEGTLARWLAKKYTSTHKWVPPPWLETWNAQETWHSTNPRDYKMAYEGTKYVDEALQAFLHFAPAHQHEEPWTEEELKQTGAYEGVSAFDNPQGALDYGAGPASGYFRYVVFEGEKLFTLKPEGREGGCAAKVVRELCSPLAGEEFIRSLSCVK